MCASIRIPPQYRFDRHVTKRTPYADWRVITVHATPGYAAADSSCDEMGKSERIPTDSDKSVGFR